MAEIIFETEKEYQEYINRIDGKFTLKRNEQLQATKERIKKIKKLNIVTNSSTLKGS